MALPRLPVLVRSLPPGALVSADGSELGTTPFILEDLSADRVDQKLTISLEGYQTVVVDPAEAAGGWRIQLDLVRAPSQVMDLGANVTSEPATIDGQVWLIGKRHVFAVDGEISRFGLDSTGGIGRSLGNPVYAPAQAIGDRIYVTTRDQIALRIEGGAVTRLPLAAETNLPLARYASPLVLDREVLVVAGLDQRLAASDNLDKPRLWTGAVGAPFACAPQVVGDGVLGLRRDGTGEVYACDTGRLLSSIDLGEPVVAAWREDGSIVAYTQKRQIRWDGVQLIKGEDLPESVIDGAAGVVITAGQSVNLVDEDGSWRLIGRYEANRKVFAPPVRWGEHVAITSANEVVVVGSRPFTVKANGDILRPTVLGNRLVVADVAGRLNFYEP